MVTKNQVVSERIDTTHKYTLATVAATSAVAEAVTIDSHKIDENQQQQQQQNPVEVKNEQLLETSGSSIMETEQHYLPKASEPPQVIIIPATQASTVATNAAKKIRRAFSMPRNPFRWSRKFKTSTPINSTSVGATDGGERNSTIITSCVSGERENAGSTISLNGDYQAVGKQANDANDKFHEKGNNSLNSLPNDRNILTNCISNNKQQISNNNNNKNINTESGGNRVIRRSSLRKFLNRIAQHVSSTVNVGSTQGNTTTNMTNEDPNNKTGFIEILPFYMGCWRKKRANKNVSGYQMRNQHGKDDRTPQNTLERVPPITNGGGGGGGGGNGYHWPPDQTPGVMGLKNHGNTCFMNAVLQCLSHTDILAEYFVLDQYKLDLKRRNKINSRKFGTKGELTEQLANVLKALWTCKNESEHSTSFKAVVDRYGSQFRSSTQHDAQEFLFWLLDKVHEDLNTATKRRYKNVRNNYGRPDDIIAAETLANHIRCNNSFVQAVFQAQFRSSLTCPRCKKQSNTFDPFHCISVQLPQLTQQSVYVTVVYMKQVPRQVRMGITVPAGSPIVALRERLQVDTGISSERIVLVDIHNEGFSRVYYDTQPVSTLQGLETIYCIEVPELIAQKTNSSTGNKNGMIATVSSSNAKNDMDSNNSKTKDLTANRRDIGESSHSPPNGELLLLVACVHKKIPKTKNDENNLQNEIKPPSGDIAKSEDEDEIEEIENVERFGVPFSLIVPRDCSYVELQKKILKEMSLWLRPEVFTYSTPPGQMFQIRLQDPSADPDTYLEPVEHPLLTEMIDLALSVLSIEAGPPHIKLLLEWREPQQYFLDIEKLPGVVDHESATRLKAQQKPDTVALTLEQCLEHYTKAETLSAEDAWRCPHCQQYLPVVKTLGLWSLPDILVVHFKRFRQHHEKGANAAKLTTMVKFPLNAFDMAPHLARKAMEMSSINNNSLQVAAATTSGPWLKKSQKVDSRSSTLSSRDNRETRYDLYAVCYHQGDTLETGHYTAACKNPYDRQWYKFDDQRVSKVPDDNILEEIINNEAYMLFYQRRNAENSECSGSSSNSGDHWVSKIAPPLSSFVCADEQQAINGDNVVNADHEEIELSEDTEKSSALSVATVTPIKLEDVLQDSMQNQDLPIVECKLTEESSVAIKLENMLEELDFVDADVGGSNEAITKTTEDTKLIKNAEEVSHQDMVMNINHVNLTNNTANSNHIDDENLKISQTVTTTTMPISTQSPEITTITTTKTLENVILLESSVVETEKKPQVVNSHSNGPTMSSPKKLSTKSASSIVTTNSKPECINSPTPIAKLNYYNKNTSNINKNVSVEIGDEDNSDDDDDDDDDDDEIIKTSGLLSSSLKSNSGSSIIGAALGSHSSEYRLERHHKLQWNGSRTSVSSAIEHHNQTPHGLSLRHSFSTSSNYKLRECNETLSSMLRNSANTCSKDTLIFLDQQSHHHHHHSHHLHHHHHHHHHNHHSLIEDDDDTFMDNRTLWISPVTPHKLITVSPKN